MSDREKWRVVYWGFLSLPTLYLFAAYATRECEVGCSGYWGFLDRWGPWLLLACLIAFCAPLVLDWMRNRTP